MAKTGPSREAIISSGRHVKLLSIAKAQRHLAVMTDVLIAFNGFLVFYPAMPHGRPSYGIHTWLDAIYPHLMIDVVLVSIMALLTLRLAWVCRVDWKILVAIVPLAFVPLINLLVAFGVSAAATRILMAHTGVRIGILGAWRRDFHRLREIVCPRCGYDTRGLLGGVCPECGANVAATSVAGVPPTMPMA